MIKPFIVVLISVTFCTAQETVDVSGKSNLRSRVGHVDITYSGRPYRNTNVSFLENGDFQFSFNNDERLKDILISFEVEGYNRFNTHCKLNNNKGVIKKIQFQPNKVPNDILTQNPLTSKVDKSKKIDDYPVLTKIPSTNNKKVEKDTIKTQSFQTQIFSNIDSCALKKDKEGLKKICTKYFIKMIETHLNDNPPHAEKNHILLKITSTFDDQIAYATYIDAVLVVFSYENYQKQRNIKSQARGYLQEVLTYAKDAKENEYLLKIIELKTRYATE